ncbi:GRAM domain-containing protein YSP2 [Nakaseomyces glabratus]|uniref:GRAM domain-containing protein YSP2 n=1 Tax=Candida glabrata TaxID=5478 RepID=A0A0W0D8F2_CANGB|nr:GRAM domain-containing protein YSP2 [Nakaseomyces glabratus]KTB14266.1 GRAM domain-containing protein YSP2 [Nakaseomyces glabratus]
MVDKKKKRSFSETGIFKLFKSKSRSKSSKSKSNSKRKNGHSSQRNSRSKHKERTLSRPSVSDRKRINTLQGYFNIPVTIDSHHTNSHNNNSGTRTNPISRKTSEFFNSKNPSKTGTQSNLQETNHTQGILDTIVSFAQNAVGRVPKIVVNDPSAEEIVDSGDKDKTTATNTLKANIPGITSNISSLSSVTTNRNGTSTSGRIPLKTEDDLLNGGEQHNDTVLHSPLNEENRSSSFLKHLDYLLSPRTSDPLKEKSTPLADLAVDNKSENSVPKHDAKLPVANKEQQRYSYNTVEEENKTMNSQGTNYTDKGLDPTKIKFQSHVGNHEPAIATFGRGNLTLDVLIDHSNSDETIDNSESRVSFKNNNPNHPGMPIFNENYRNSSYIDVQRHLGLNKGNEIGRGRSRTLPTNDASAVLDQKIEGDSKRNSRITTLSNDEIVGDNDRKPRSLSRKFLNRRSFSPSIGSKVLPSMAFRNSMNKTRNSNDKMDTSKPRSSGVFSATVNSTQDTEYTKPFSLVGIEYSSEKKNIEFHNIFKDAGVTPQERLILDHSCALSRDILLQGRMYISDQHIGFNSNILGFVSTVFIPFKEIVQIEKKTTAGIFPNGIVIDTLHSKYIFASFISRDATFNLITDVWNQIILGRRYSDDTDQSDYSSRLNDLSDSNSLYNQLKDIDDDGGDDAALSDIDSTDMTSSEEVEDIIGSGIGIKKTKGQIKSLSLGPSQHEPTSSGYKPTNNEKLVTEFLVEAPLGTVVNLLYGENTKYITDILASMKSTDISPIPKLLGTSSRKFNYVKPLPGNIGPSKTKCFITETLDHYDLEKYVKVSQVSDTPDVPSGNVFSARSVFLFTWDKDNNTKVVVYGCVDWKGKSWLKSFIEKGTMDGILEVAKTTHHEIKTILNNQSSSEQSVEDNGDSAEEVIEESNLPKMGPLSHQPTEPPFSKESEDTVIEENVNFQAPLGTIFQILFGDDTSYIKKMIEKQNNFNLSEIPPFNNKMREFTYTKRLANSFGPKQTRCFITEKIEHMDLNSYILVRQIVKSPDVPSGNNFAVHTRTYLTWGNDNSTNMLVVTNVEWSGKSLLKGTIEKGSIEGQRVTTKQVIEELRDIIANAGSSRKKLKKRSKTITSLKKVTSQPLEKKPDTVAQNMDSSANLLDQFVSFVMELDFTSLKGIGFIIITVFLFFLLLRGVFFSNAKSATKIIRPGVIIIDGEEYSYVPNSKTIYNAYEKKIGKFDYSFKSDDNNPVMESEFLIWDWLDDRTNGNSNNLSFRKQYKRGFKPVKTHKLQQLKESIKIAENELNEMKRMLNEEEELLL